MAAEEGRRQKADRRVPVQATVGDRIVVKGHHLGQPDRDGEILEVHGLEGGPPYVVRWSDTGEEGLFFPGSDASIQHFGDK
jgi:Domain of unknown function (DUF1918)